MPLASLPATSRICRSVRLTRLLSVAVLLAVAAVTAAAEGQLVWAQQRVVRLAEPGVEAVGVGFGFTNAGDTAVTFAQVESGCDCVTATLEKKTYQPGESDEVDRPRLTLELRVSIRERVRVRPRLLVWSADEPRTPKEALVTVLGREAMVISLAPQEKKADEGDAAAQDNPEAEAGVTAEVTAEAAASPPSLPGAAALPMGVVLEVLEEGKTYRVVVTPPDDAAEHQAVIQLEAETDNDELILRPLRLLARTVAAQPNDGQEAKDTQDAAAVATAGDEAAGVRGDEGSR